MNANAVEKPYDKMPWRRDSRAQEDAQMEVAAPGSISEVALGAALDPFKPNEIVPPPGVRAIPPVCPVDNSFLHPINQNSVGDILFECLGCGYEAVYRVETNRYEPRPGREVSRWQSPGRRARRTPVTMEAQPEGEERPEEPPEGEPAESRPEAPGEEESPGEQETPPSPEPDESEATAGECSLKEAAQMLGVDALALSKMILRGEVPYVRRGGKIFVRLA